MSNNWNGIGCPEVGESVLIAESTTLYDQRTRDFSGKEVLVEATFHFDGKFCLAISHPTRGIGAVIFSTEWVKPIKSDRDKAIDEMEAEWNAWSGTNTRSSLGRLYDAGFRKQSGE